MKPRQLVTPAIEKAVIADRMAGLRTTEIGARYGLHRVTVSRICSRFRREEPRSELASPAADYKLRLKTKAISAVEAGLDDASDNYKRGNLGVVTLKGIGEFQGEQPSTQGVQITICLPPTLQVPEAVMIDAEPERQLLPETDRDEEPPKEKTEDSKQ